MRPYPRCGAKDGITRSHLCLYRRFRLFKSAEMIKRTFSSSGLHHTVMQTCAPDFVNETGALSRFRVKKQLRHEFSCLNCFLERKTGFEPATTALGRQDSTVELLSQFACRLSLYIAFAFFATSIREFIQRFEFASVASTLSISGDIIPLSPFSPFGSGALCAP